jgi:hypothetical protein
MQYIKTFNQLNESNDSNTLEKLLSKFSENIDSDKLKSFLEPYKETLKKYYNKYSKDGVIDAQLIYNDFRKFNFSANERYDWEDYADDESKSPILRLLYKIFVRFPKNFVTGIWEFFKETVIDSFRDGDIMLGVISSFLWAMVAILVFIIGVFTYQATDWYFNGLESGKVITELQFTPEHEQPIVHTVSTGKSSYTYVTYIHVPDTWTTEVEGDNGRIEDWSTTNPNLVDKVKIGTPVKNDNDWQWAGTEKR